MPTNPKCKNTGKLKKTTDTGRVCKKKPGPKKSPKKKTVPKKSPKKKTVPKKSPKKKTVPKKSPKCKDTGKLKKPTDTGRVCKKKTVPKKSHTKEGSRSSKDTIFYCVKCKEKVKIKSTDIFFLTKQAKGRTINMLKGEHPVCGIQCHKIVAVADVPRLKKKYKTCE